MKAMVFANGEFAPPADMEARMDAAELLIAADGGLAHMEGLGALPHVVVGDLDSIPAKRVEELKAGGVAVRGFPKEKDKTDLELALLEAEQRGAKEVDVLAGLGRRWDHSLANILMASLPEFEGLQITYLHGEERLFLICEEADIEAKAGTRLSLIPLGGDAERVSTSGLAYALAGETLSFGSSRGISNQFVLEKARVQLEGGCLLCVLSPNETN